MLVDDNLPEIQCQDHEIIDGQVYHSGHHRDQDHLRMMLSFDYYQMPGYLQGHTSDGV